MAHLYIFAFPQRSSSLAQRAGMQTSVRNLLLGKGNLQDILFGLKWHVTKSILVFVDIHLLSNYVLFGLGVFQYASNMIWMLVTIPGALCESFSRSTQSFFLVLWEQSLTGEKWYLPPDCVLFKAKSHISVSDWVYFPAYNSKLMKLCLSCTFVKVWVFTSLSCERTMILACIFPFLDIYLS